MKAITLWQPWASLWLSPAKRFETRRWPTGIRGWVLVHAAKKLVRLLPADLDDVVQDEFGCSWPDNLPTGALIGAVNLVGCHPTGLFAPHAGSDELACGDWTPGRFCWERDESYQRFEIPIPYRGSQRFFFVPDSALPDGTRWHGPVS